MRLYEIRKLTNFNSEKDCLCFLESETENLQCQNDGKRSRKLQQLILS